MTMPDDTDVIRDGPSLLFTRPGRRPRVSIEAQRLFLLILLTEADAVLSPAEMAFAAGLTDARAGAAAMRELVDAGFVAGEPAGPGRVHITVLLGAL